MARRLLHVHPLRMNPLRVQGMVPRSCEQIFSTAASLSKDGWEFSVSASL